MVVKNIECRYCGENNLNNFYEGKKTQCKKCTGIKRMIYNGTVRSTNDEVEYFCARPVWQSEGGKTFDEIVEYSDRRRNNKSKTISPGENSEGYKSEGYNSEGYKSDEAMRPNINIDMVIEKALDTKLSDFLRRSLAFENNVTTKLETMEQRINVTENSTGELDIKYNDLLRKYNDLMKKHDDLLKKHKSQISSVNNPPLKLPVIQ